MSKNHKNQNMKYHYQILQLLVKSLGSRSNQMQYGREKWVEKKILTVFNNCDFKSISLIII